jgi:hypothetical protein
MSNNDKSKNEEERSKSLPELKPNISIYSRDNLKDAVNRVAADAGGLWHQRFDNEANQCRANGENDEEDALRFLSCITQAFLKPSDVQRPFGPMFEMEGSRGIIPDDFDDEQIALIAELAPWSNHPILQARLYDVHWLRSRNIDAARNAISAYVEATNLLIELSSDDDSSLIVPAMNYLERATRLSLYAFKEDDRPDVALNKILSVGPVLRGAGHHAMVLRIKQLQFELNLGDGNHHANFIEAIAKEDRTSINPHILRDLWILAAQWRQRLDDLPKSRISSINAAEAMVELAATTASSADPSNMAAASHLSEALKIYRQVSGEDKRKNELRELLSEYQSGIAEEMTSHSVEMDLSEPADQAKKHVSGRTLPSALAALAFMCPSSDLKDLEAQVWELADKNPLQYLMTISLTDRDGRTAQTVPSLLSNENKTEVAVALRYHMIKVAEFNYSLKGFGMVVPACAQIWEEHYLSEDVLVQLANQSDFVPIGHENLFARGLYEGLNGNYQTALHILVPQVENALRELLKSQGHLVATKEKSDKILQEAISLPKILEHKAIKEMLEEGLLFDLQAILTDNLGGGMRHGIAHGFYSDGQLNSAAGTYLFSLILQMVIAPSLLVTTKDNSQ